MMISDLIELGYSAARYPDMEPMFVTDASFDDDLDI